MLRLGHCDQNKIPLNRKGFLDAFHNVPGVLKNTVSFREDDRSKWRRFSETPGQEVSELQKFLSATGFMPHSDHSGIFGYATQGAVRLFQEYVRSVEGLEDVKPDGYVGGGTQRHIERWKKNGLICRWSISVSNPSHEYTNWFKILENAHSKAVQQPSDMHKQVNGYIRSSDTKKVNNWIYNTTDVHLIGIRVNETMRVVNRSNDDLFVLLINGMVFKFWGSTDPSQGMANRTDEPFLVEGQHKYRFAWHKINNENKVYRALRPYEHGVLVHRDRDNDNALTSADINRGLDTSPNHTINIHWSGKGNTNFSAGCQVIAGNSYCNDKDDVVDCSKYAAKSYFELTDTAKKTKGAYNVIADIIISFAAFGSDFLYYTLGTSKSLGIHSVMGDRYVEQEVTRMKIR